MIYPIIYKVYLLICSYCRIFLLTYPRIVYFFKFIQKLLYCILLVKRILFFAIAPWLIAGIVVNFYYKNALFLSRISLENIIYVDIRVNILTFILLLSLMGYLLIKLMVNSIIHENIVINLIITIFLLIFFGKLVSLFYIYGFKILNCFNY